MSKPLVPPPLATSAPAAVAAIAESASPAILPKFDPSKIKVVKQVSTNLLKLRSGAVAYVLITGPMDKAKALKNQSDEDKKKEPPTLIPIVNLETGEVQAIIAGSVLVDLLTDEYPKNAYVGKSFRITVKDQKDAKAGGGRRYNNYDVVEIAI